MKKLKTIIAEDSEEQLRLIRQLVEDNCPPIAVVAEAMTLDDAYTAIKQHQPDLVLLDVEFHAGATSFNLLDRLIGEGMVDFEIVFFSAHAEQNNYAPMAFKYAALQCLQKPIDIEKLLVAIGRAVLLNEAKDAVQLRAKYDLLMDLVKTKNFDDSPFFVRIKRTQWKRLSPNDVLYLQSAGTGTVFHLQDGTKITAMDMIGSYDYLHENPQFFRIHQSYIANLSFVRDYDPTERLLYLNNGEHLVVARDPDRELRRRMRMKE